MIDEPPCSCPPRPFSPSHLLSSVAAFFDLFSQTCYATDRPSCMGYNSTSLWDRGRGGVNVPPASVSVKRRRPCGPPASIAACGCAALWTIVLFSSYWSCLPLGVTPQFYRRRLIRPIIVVSWNLQRPCLNATCYGFLRHASFLNDARQHHDKGHHG